MLVISRKIGEAIRIGPDIVIVVSGIQGKQVRVAISAPSSVAVARGELEPCAAHRPGAPVDRTGSLDENQA